MAEIHTSKNSENILGEKERPALWPWFGIAAVCVIQILLVTFLTPLFL